MVELIRRVIPRDIVGGNVVKLRRMDATVHILCVRTSAATCLTPSATRSPALLAPLRARPSSSASARTASVRPALCRRPTHGAVIITPCCYAAAAITWWFIGPLDFKQRAPNLEGVDRHRSLGARLFSYPLTILNGAKLFVLSIVRGATLIFGSRKLVWLFPCAEPAHRSALTWAAATLLPSMVTATLRTESLRYLRLSAVRQTDETGLRSSRAQRLGLLAECVLTLFSLSSSQSWSAVAISVRYWLVAVSLTRAGELCGALFVRSRLGLP